MPTYLLVAVFSYFLLGLGGLIDKVLLRKAIVSPRAYAFFVGIIGLFALIFLPFGVTWPVYPRFLFAALASGAVSVYGLWAFYNALKDFEASRVITTIGALTPPLTLVLSIILFSEVLLASQLLAVFLLVLGGVLVSVRANVRGTYSFDLFQHAILAAGLFAFSLAFLRFVFLNESFINGLFWSRMGSVIGALSIVAVPENFKRIYWAAKKAPRFTPIPFLVNQGLGGTGALLQTFAISLGSATLVSALQGVQYVFVFILAIFLSRPFPELAETLDPEERLVKLVSVAAVAAGLYFLTIK